MNLVLGKHLRRYRLEPLEGVKVSQKRPNQLDVSYEPHNIEFRITYGDDFPFIPPRIFMKSPLWHPNVERGVLICDLFADQWSPGLTIDKVILSVVSLILAPDPICSNVATKYYVKRRKQYLDVVQYERKKTNKKWITQWTQFLWKYFPLPEDILYNIATMMTYKSSKHLFLVYKQSNRKRKRI